MATYNYRRQYTIEHTPSLYSHHQYVNWQRILVVINYSLVILIILISPIHCFTANQISFKKRKNPGD